MRRHDDVITTACQLLDFQTVSSHIPAVEHENLNGEHEEHGHPAAVLCFLCQKSHVFFSQTRWKIHEACMLALGSVKTIITENVKNGRIQFDMHGFLAGVVLADLNLAGES